MRSLVWLWVPEIKVGKTQHNLYFTWLWCLDMLTYANATFNIVVYYAMGSRYRQTFWMLLGRNVKATKLTKDQAQDSSSNTEFTTMSVD